MGEHEYTEPLLFSAPEIDLGWPGCDTVYRLAGGDWNKELARGSFHVIGWDSEYPLTFSSGIVILPRPCIF